MGYSREDLKGADNRETLILDNKPETLANDKKWETLKACCRLYDKLFVEGE